MKRLLFASLIFLNSCAPTLVTPASKQLDLCGTYIEQWSNSIGGSPNYWPCKFALWTMADAINHSENDTHVWYFPGATADSITTNFYTLGNQSDRWVRAQFLQLCENSLLDTASIFRDYAKIIADLQAHGNNNWYVIGCIDQNDGTPGFPKFNQYSPIVKHINAELFLIYKDRFIDPNVIFIPYCTSPDEITMGLIPRQYTQDGRHLTQEGANILGMGYATYLKPCPVGAQ